MGEAKRKADDATLERLMQVQAFLAAKAREEGRLRIRSADLRAIGPGSRIDVRHDASGDVIVTYLGDGEA